MRIDQHTPATAIPVFRTILNRKDDILWAVADGTMSPVEAMNELDDLFVQARNDAREE